MANILIPATKSLTVTNKLPNGNINTDTISVGGDGKYNYISYLFFDISSIPSNISVINAELVLFKTNNFYNDSKKEFFLHPLSDYFSTYTTFNNSPKVYTMIGKKFYPLTSKISVTINLTHLVSIWLKNELTNTCISLSGKNNSIVAEFGSAICTDTYLIPFINVFTTPIIDSESNCFKTVNCTSKSGTTTQVRVTGTVAKYSQYQAIVNIGVTRSVSGHTDNYYVTDEYNNLLSDSPLHVDKTYNVAIIPKETPGDVETLNFYGSYKG